MDFKTVVIIIGFLKSVLLQGTVTQVSIVIHELFFHFRQKNAKMRRDGCVLKTQVCVHFLQRV